mmetsp:Transcript_5453/g.10741  ORF Transcript_5453/g.10741 Transcript_5453/m.10741 type:complete len:175 (-) Transcript_5453:165-689(-)
MPGRATPTYADTGKPKIKVTAVQERAQFGEQIALENHHEANLPSQRYRERNKLPPTRNPIVPTHIHASLLPDEEYVDGFMRAMDEVNARSRQPLPASNPIFGYSVHRPPAVMAESTPGQEGPWSEISALGRSETPGSQASEQSSSSKRRMAELQQKIHEEREKRTHLEKLLASG